MWTTPRNDTTPAARRLCQTFNRRPLSILETSVQVRVRATRRPSPAEVIKTMAHPSAVFKFPRSYERAWDGESSTNQRLTDQRPVRQRGEEDHHVGQSR